MPLYEASQFILDDLTSRKGIKQFRKYLLLVEQSTEVDAKQTAQATDLGEWDFTEELTSHTAPQEINIQEIEVPF